VPLSASNGAQICPCRGATFFSLPFLHLASPSRWGFCILGERYTESPQVGKRRAELCDLTCRGLYIEVRASNPGSGTYYLRYKAGGKTAHQSICKTSDISLSDARMKAAALKAEITLRGNLQSKTNTAQSMPTLDDYFQNTYLPHQKLHIKSSHSHESLYRRYLKDKWGTTPLDRIRRQDIQLHHNALLASGLAPATANHMVKQIKHLLGLAVSWGLIEKNEASRTKMFVENNKVEHHLNDAQLERLMTVLRTDENRRVCLIAMWLISTGARLGEALRSEWHQIDKENRVWRIPASNSKSKRVRIVPLNDSAMEVLAQLGTEGKQPHLFLSRTGERMTTISKVWGRLRLKAELPDLRIHDLRHQFASFLVNAGTPIYTVQEILGHSDPKITMRYSHLSTKSLQEAANNASVAIKGAIKKVA